MPTKTSRTGLEIFLRDIYAILMSVRHVKEGESLYWRFHSESKNDFSNLGKSMQRYRRDLSIALKEKLTRTELKSLNLLFNKRHVIVHNNAFVDQVFLDQTGLNLPLKGPLPIDAREIERGIDLLRKVENALGSQYKKEVGGWVIEMIDQRVGR